MEIKAVGPVVFTNEAEKVLAQIESLGFSAKHTKDNMATTTAFSQVYLLENPNGSSLAVVQGDRFTRTYAGVRYSVDNFDEAVAHFEKLGYVNLQTEGKANSGSSFATLLRSPEGLTVCVFEHFK